MKIFAVRRAVDAPQIVRAEVIFHDEVVDCKV
jgi:hypothetical protein